MRVANPTISGAVETIEGDVVDAEYCKATGLMVLAAKNPSRIYFIKSGQPLKSLDLNKIPVCVTISESGDVVAAAFTNTDLTLINPENLTITKNISTGMISSDLALKGNSWAYLSPKQYDSYNLLSVDLNSEQIIKNPTSMSGLSLLKKVPGKNLLYCSKVGWSPDFLVVFDISQGAAHDVADQWNVTLLNFCFSEDGQNIFTGTRKIYQGPAFLQKGFIHETPVLAGIIEETATSANSLYHSMILKELFVVYKYNSSNGTRLLRIDDEGYFTKNAFSVNNCVVVENGNMGSLPTEVPYMYVSKSGKELHLVKKGIGSSKSYWFYEKISL